MASMRWYLCISYLFVITLLLTRSESEETHVEDTVKTEVENGEAAEVDEKFVQVLTSENFDDTVNNNPTILVEFYTPWCEHCKFLAPQYAAAAEELAAHDPPVVLAKVDATTNVELAKRFQVAGFPTLKFFKNGKNYEFDEPANKESIVEYMGKVAHPGWEPELEAVITLTKDNFDEVVKAEKLMLVEFYTPESEHSKLFVPIYERTAIALKKEDPPIILAKVDAAQETELATKYGVTKYPTLKVFKYGRAVSFKGEIGSPYDIMYYMKNQLKDGAREITNVKMLRDLLVPDEISVVGFFDSSTDPKAAPYTDLVTEIRDEFNFGIVFDDELRKVYNINRNSVVVFTGERFHTKHEPKWYVLKVKDETTSDDIFDFLKDHHLPLVGQYVRPLTNHYDKIRPLCLVFYTVDFGFDGKDATQFWRHKIADVAVRYPEITFAIADDEEHSNLLQQFGLDESGEEINIGLFGTDGRKYALEAEGEFDDVDITEFLNKYKQGELKPYIKSQTTQDSEGTINGCCWGDL
uniref:Thioredoxin domain-containing protein n=2 Tax=Arion vulgaris TaxID=1028688 RepID=A0A0B6YWC7_9EUPU